MPGKRKPLSDVASGNTQVTASPQPEAFRRQPRQTRGHRRVDLLLDAAATVIARDGVQAATAEAIATEARTAKGSFYQFFPNRDAVLAALALRYSDDLRRIHEETFSADRSAISLSRLIDQIVRPMAAFHDNNPAFGRVFAISDAADGGRSAPGRVRSQLFQSFVERLDLLIASRNPQLSPRDRRRVSLVAAAIGQAILARRDMAASLEKKALLDDLRQVLLLYLSPVLEPTAESARTATPKRTSRTGVPSVVRTKTKPA